MADEHLLQEQRSYNSLCMTYGSNPSKYAFIVNEIISRKAARIDVRANTKEWRKVGAICSRRGEKIEKSC